jgi:hypothetical protein
VQDPRLADHAVGLELELGELVEQHERAVVQGRTEDAVRLQRSIDSLQTELARTAEQLAEEPAAPEVHGAVSAESA